MSKVSRRVTLAFSVCVIFSSCGHHQAARVTVPVAPPPVRESQKSPAGGEAVSSADAQKEPDTDVQTIPEPLNHKIIFSETGIASWYGPPYHNRRGSDGKIYNMNAMTAAHRTLPLGSIVRVTNLKTGHSAVVRITDRGPFIEGRILDLSLAAARKTDVQRAGLAQVRVECLEAPAPIETGGRWAVQIGGFDQHESATKVADEISRRYHSAKVLSFSSPVGDWWVRVRVLHDDRARAQEVARNTPFDRGKIFLVRLD